MTTTLEEINKRNREFWKDQQVLTESRIADEAVFRTALEIIESETRRDVPVRCQMSLEAALQDAAIAKRRFMSQFGRKGGMVAKADALDRLILDLLGEDPGITPRKLLFRLKRQPPRAPIQQIKQGLIFFEDHGGQERQAKISGLKDRLYRVREKISSR